MLLKSMLYTSLLFFHVAISSAYEYIPIDAISGRVGEDIQPKDVYARSLWLEKEIKLVDVDNNLTSSNTIPAYRVTKAKPYEVNFIAKSVLNKAQRLCFTYTKSLGGHTPKSRLFHDKPVNVFRLLNQSMISIQFVKQANEIKTRLNEEIVADATPSDVYNKLLVNSRMISNLNTNKIKPSDVLAIVDEAYGVAVALKQDILKSNYKLNTGVVNEVQYSDKSPQDVFYNLISLFDLITKYASDNLSKELLRLEPINVDREIEPSDVIDLASLVLAELTFLANSNSILLRGNSNFLYESDREVTPSTVYNRINEIYTILNDNN